MDRQTLRDWVHRYNAGGVEGLISRTAPSPTPRLTPEQMNELRDVVIAGINRDHLAALVILDLDGCRSINPDLPAGDIAAAASDPVVGAEFRKRFESFLGVATGSSTRITRAVLLDTPLSIDRGEVTDKGSVNQRAVLEHRAAVVDDLYSTTPPSQVIALQ